jgi:hypothetical protein
VEKVKAAQSARDADGTVMKVGDQVVRLSGGPVATIVEIRRISLSGKDRFDLVIQSGVRRTTVPAIHVRKVG